MRYISTYVRKESCSDYSLTLQQFRHIKTGKVIIFACVCRSAAGGEEQCASAVDRLRKWFLAKMEMCGIRWNRVDMQQEVQQILEELLQNNGSDVLALSGILALDNRAILFGKDGGIRILNRSYGAVYSERWSCCQGIVQTENVTFERGVGILCHVEEGKDISSDLWQSLNPGQIKNEEQLQARFREWMEHAAPFCAAIYLVSV